MVVSRVARGTGSGSLDRPVVARAPVTRFIGGWASDYLCEFEDTDAQLFSSSDVRAAVQAGAAVAPLFGQEEE